MAPRDGPDTRAVIICLRPCLHHFCHFKLSMACGSPTAPPHTILSIPYPEGAPHPLIFCSLLSFPPSGALGAPDAITARLFPPVSTAPFCFQPSHLSFLPSAT